MVNVVVEDLPQYVGPGDIVGAFTNEAQIDGNKIGKIDFVNDKALVEVAEDVVEQVVEAMDSNQVAGIKVRVYIDNEARQRINKVNDYVEKFKYLVEMERKAEMRQHRLEMENLSGYQREERGRAILDLRGRDQGETFGAQKMIKFMRQRPGEELPDHQLNVGDLVMLSRGQPLRTDNPTGTVAEKTNYSLTVLFNQAPSFLYAKGLRADLYVNDITFQRMLAALSKIEQASGRLGQLRDKFLGLEELEVANSELEVEFKNQDLNQFQRQAVKRALAAEDFFLIHGPPGTGKTITAIEIIRQAMGSEQDILATADSNTAVDNLVERLVEVGVEVVRVGHPVRVTPALRQHTLDYLIEEHPSYQEATRLRKEAYQLLDQQEDLTHPSGRWRRGMSNQQIKEQAYQGGKNFRGVPVQKIKEMAQWLQLQEQIDGLFERIDSLEEEAVRELLNRARVVCTTNSTAGAEILDAFEFDLLVVDEATQSTEPATLIPLVKAKRAVLVGDHKQLPPTILSARARGEGLACSLFERLIDLYGEQVRHLLKIQYRMNDAIMNFPSQEFYNGLLESAAVVAEHSLADLNILEARGNRPAEKALLFSKPIVFFDTRGMNAPERSKNGSNSIENPIEADIVVEIVEEALKLALNPEQIAVITPYQDQVELIKQKLQLEELEVNSVDGFQGREKEVIILSLVRSNQYQNIGFLRDLRRLNVSLTRAKRKLIIVADSDTISCSEVYSKLVEYIKNVGYYYNL